MKSGLVRASGVFFLSLIVVASGIGGFPRPVHALFGDDALAVKEYVLDPLAYIASKIVMQSITRSAVNWINSGFNGSPAFVTDLKSSLRIAGDAYASSFINQLETNVGIQSPFRDIVSSQLRDNYYRTTSNGGFFSQNSFTLGEVSSDPQAFLDGSFEKGGFNAFFSAGQHCGNNPYCFGDAAGRQLANGVLSTQDAKKTTLAWGDGWNSFCGNPKPTPGSVNLTQTDPCFGGKIKTLGSTIKAQWDKIGGASIDQLVSADEINEILGALMSQLVGHVLGATGLSGLSDPSAGGGSSFIDQATDPSQLTSNSGTALTTTLNTTLTNHLALLSQYQASWQAIQNAANNAKSACKNNQARVNGTIQPVLDRANDAIAKAASSIAAFSLIQTSISQATASLDPSTLLQNTESAYNAALKTGPSPDEITDGIAQGKDSGFATTQTLYTQMINANAACSSGQ